MVEWGLSILLPFLWQKSVEEKLEFVTQAAQEKQEDMKTKMASLTSVNQQLSEDLEVKQKSLQDLQAQLQKKEIAIATATGKVDILTTELQAKVTTQKLVRCMSVLYVCVCVNISCWMSCVSVIDEPNGDFFTWRLKCLVAANFSFQEAALSKAEHNATQEQTRLREKLSLDAAHLSEVQQSMQQLQETFDKVIR